MLLVRWGKKKNILALAAVLICILLAISENICANTILELADAAYFGEIEKVTGLLDSGIDVNGLTDKGYSALHTASQAGHFEIIKLLLKHGANKNITDHDAEKPIDWAISYGRVKVVLLLLEGDSNNMESPHLIRALQVKLKDMRYYNGKSDGKESTALSNAISSFQKDFGSEVDGKLTNELINNIITAHTLNIPEENRLNTNILMLWSDLRKYKWNGNRSRRTIDGNVSYGLNEYGNQEFSGHFAIGNLIVNGTIEQHSYGIMFKRGTVISLSQ